MKVGDLVVFIDKGTYAKWFFGRMGVVQRYTPKGADGLPYCNVKWLQPTKYFDGYTAASSFKASCFKVIK